MPDRPRGRCWGIAAVTTLVLASVSGAAIADDLAPVPATPPEPPAAEIDPADDEDLEIGLVPLVGGDTDHGFGAGALGTIAMFDRDHHPYRWKVEFGGFYAVKDSLTSPSFVDAYARLIYPQLLNRRLRLEVRPSFTSETVLRYYGIGNRSDRPQDDDRQRDTYERLHPSLGVTTLWQVGHDLALLFGARYTYNRIAFDPASTLAEDPIWSSHDLRAPHSVVVIEGGVVFDSRDNELAPTTGQHHMVKLRVSPRAGDVLPYGYQQINATARVYHTIVPRYLVLAVRAVFDLQLGDVPFYEMSRYEEASAIGGGNGVRGVPSHRFYGRVKAFGNVELRSDVSRFRWRKSRYIFGVTGFYDVGRLWTDIEEARPDLDGTGLGLHHGVGGGLRLQKGRSFLLRADVAWSPDAQPVGVYVKANHAF
ncbi:MAG: BamA/TamA family outer membrane protein [Myxococcota bacterium]|nr:BamA/TamA family outer membrane protein [Myxococcota bacterium]